MGLHTARTRFGEPGPDLAAGLGRLLVASAHLRRLCRDVSSERTETWSGEAHSNWTELTLHVLDLNDRIVAAAAEMRFTGYAAEHIRFTTGEGLRVAADAAYITALSRRMDRHSRLGRVLLGEVAGQQESVPA